MRRLRVNVGGGVYRGCNRLARGAAAFAEADKSGHILQSIRGVRDRDDVTIFAPRRMANRYHLAS